MGKSLQKLTWKKGLAIYGVSWVITFLVVFGLRQALIDRDELNCYARVHTIQKAVDQWNQAHPDKLITEDIDENALTQAGLLPAQTYDPQKHYYFVGQTPWGPKVKCNKHEDNPLILKLVGDCLLAILGFVAFCSYKGYVLFDGSEK
jgi:hypothetical protein